MGNFAENLNLGNRFRPPPPVWSIKRVSIQNAQSFFISFLKKMSGYYEHNKVDPLGLPASKYKESAFSMWLYAGGYTKHYKHTFTSSPFC